MVPYRNFKEKEKDNAWGSMKINYIFKKLKVKRHYFVKIAMFNLFSKYTYRKMVSVGAFWWKGAVEETV